MAVNYVQVKEILWEHDNQDSDFDVKLSRSCWLGAFAAGSDDRRHKKLHLVWVTTSRAEICGSDQLESLLIKVWLTNRC